MPSRFDNNQLETLAEFVSASVHRSKFSAYKILIPIARELPGIKRFSWDESLLKTIKGISAVDNEEIIGQLRNSSFPFDKMWIEGPTFIKHHDQWDASELKTVRVGILVIANQQECGFQFKLVRELLHADDFVKALQAMGGNKKDPTFPYVINGKVVTSEFGKFVKVSPAVGIDLNEESLIETLAGYQNEVAASGQPIRVHPETAIDDLYDTANFLSRFFVLLSNKHFPNNFAEAETESEAILKKKNITRKGMGLKPILSTKPIQIDISQSDQDILHSDNQKEIRLLLGWTSVRRSKPIISKHGKIFRREPHDRRIAAPVDRRKAAREVVSSGQGLISGAESGRPIRVREPSQPTEKPSGV